MMLIWCACSMQVIYASKNLVSSSMLPEKKIRSFMGQIPSGRNRAKAESCICAMRFRQLRHGKKNGVVSDLQRCSMVPSSLVLEIGSSAMAIFFRDLPQKYGSSTHLTDQTPVSFPTAL
ncbi:unnamed protein product [Kuraishia capsulata CBS 1993]|uniref:Uncharacterized protein n=1 Tax=Kuraishia capsulata CBS 1993 TaxID=1382522 RepID=W6MMH9_9ASCO|nr:uncharacterized protein KUCA_T00003778001 [Kuraishia capsulata CBS 1993]CDK27799.1 unnamed protein product [Kuraishia capsulata CBS 1993]